MATGSVHTDDQSKYIFRLAHTHTLIIGGTSGIGYALAEAILEYGGDVTVSSSSPSNVDAAISRLRAAYPSRVSQIRGGHVCDLGNAATIDSAVHELFEKTGAVDHVVYTAGDRIATTPVSEVSMAQIQQAGMVRFFGPLMVAKYAPKYLTAGPSSSITLTTGYLSEKPAPGWAVPGSFAGGIRSMGRGLALDLAPVRVNIISLGAVDTEIWGHGEGGAKQELLNQFQKKTVTGRVGKVEDVVEAYLYAMKDRNLTGTVISTNGGVLLV